MLRGVIFDFDGVLVDSERAHFEGSKAALLEHAGFEITFDEYTEHYLAYDDHGGIRRALERHDRPAGPAVVEGIALRKKVIFEDLLPGISFLPGAPDLVLALHGEGVPLAIASGARRHEIESLLQRQGLEHAFRGIVSVDDVDNCKPHPEPYLRARRLVDAAESAHGVMAFEDSVPGIAAARAADLRVVAVTNSHPRSRLGLAHHVVDSLAELTLPGLEALARA